MPIFNLDNQDERNKYAKSDSEKEQITFEVTLTFTDIMAKNPLEATKKILKWIEEDASNMIYDVKNELTGEKFTVDLSENDEDAVLPNND
jgi:hypothetical protein